MLIQTLILHWNQIKEKGAVALARAFRKNVTVQIFDGSFNAFGTSQPYKKRKHPKYRKETKDTQDLDWGLMLKDSDSESDWEHDVEYLPE